MIARAQTRLPAGCGQHGRRVVVVSVSRSRSRTVCARAGAVDPGATVLVAGATGGVGQLVTAKLLERGYKVKALTRSAAKVRELFGDAAGLTAAVGDTRDAATLAAAADGVDAIACCTGTTAFPSARWKGKNGPRETDLEGTTNLIRAAPKTLKRFVFVTSAGVERQKQFPWLVLNAFGVLTFKREAEQALEASGLPWTILRPSRLTDGPYTSYDLNTLLKATAGTRRDAVLSPDDDLAGEASRITVAEAVVQALSLPGTEGRAYAIESKEGAGPGSNAAKWAALFSACDAKRR